MRGSKPRWVKELARDSIYRLLRLAEQVYKEDRNRGRRYVELALRISRKYNVRLPQEYKKRICKNCHALMIPGFNARVRTSRSGVVLWICEECGHVRKFGYVKEKSKKSHGKGEGREKRVNRGSNSRGKKASGKGPVG